MSSYLSHVLEQSYSQIWQFTQTALILGILEFLLPIERGHSLQGRLRAWFLNVLTYLIGGLFLYPLSLFSETLNPIFTVDLMTLVSEEQIFYLPYIYLIVPLIPAFVNDFFFYVWHRTQHTIPFLWRFHSLHHAVEELNATSPLQHWSESILQFLTITVPAVVLFKFNFQSLGYLYLYLRLWNGIIHCNIRVQHPFFNWVLGGPQYHRIHHSTEKRHLNKNFAFFPFWDFVFGTHYNPTKGEFPKTGIVGLKPNWSFKNYLLWGITNKGYQSDDSESKSEKKLNSVSPIPTYFNHTQN